MFFSAVFDRCDAGPYFSGFNFSSSILIPAGFTLLVFGTFVIIWTERTSHNFKQDSLDKHAFYSGIPLYPQSYHFGLFLLVMGFGFIANAFFVVLTTLISFY